MRLLDEKGRIFGKVSIIDVLIVVILLGVAGWFGYAMFGKNLHKDVAERERTIEITVVTTGIRPTTAEAIKKSTRMFEFKTGAYIGDLVGVRIEPAEVWTVSADGRLLRMKTEDRVDAYVTIRGQARIGEDVIIMNGVEVRVGTSIGLKSKMAVFTGYITDMNLEAGGTP